MDPASVRRRALRSLAATGLEDVSLSALSVSDYPYLEETVTALMEDLAGQKVSLSLSSLRPKGLSASVAENILKVRKTGFTLVPEAGTDRLRRVINKELDNQEILDAARTAFGRGWRLLKLYFMVGLPTEKDEDLEGIVRLVEEILQLGRGVMKTPPRINLSLSSFIPKPHTPFQWLPMEEEPALRERQGFIRSRLSRFRSVAIKAHPTEISVLEGIFSRGDRRLGSALVQAWKRGARFDSWKDRFDLSRWQASFSAERIEPQTYLGPLAKDAVLPWDHIETGIKKEFLLSELAKAIGEERTASCLDRKCALCRGCDLPVRRTKTRPRPPRPASLKPAGLGRRTDRLVRYEVFFEKSGLARFLSHRDLTAHLQRSLRRAGVEVAHSAGFHPKMLVSYPPALPLGMEAKEECFEFKSARRYQIDALLRRLQRSSRSGIRFLRLRRVGDSEASLNDRISGAVYSLDLTDDDVAAALEARKILLGARTVDDADFIRNSLADFIARNVGSQLAFRLDPDEGKLFLELPALSRRGLRPQDIVSAVIGLDTPSVRLTRERLIFRLGAERSARVSAD
jgi:radical SAM-linked protein